jgi:hypothetical protein
MRTSQFRFLLWQFIACSDSGKYDDISFSEVYQHAKDETISRFLIDRFGKDLDVSIIDASDWATLNTEWSSMANAIDAQRKFGVSNRGLSLLMAYTLESIQQRRRPEGD